MIQKFKLQSENTDHQNLIEVLKNLVPESVKDGKIDFDILKEILGNNNLLDEEEIAEPWGLNWTGKRQARKLAMTPTRATLRPLHEQGINEDSTQNIFIEGDNLEVLKTLQKSYFGKIKMIYIDPPYNTGNDFVYKDDFTDNLQNYIERQGKNLHSNKKDAGRFHANWLNFMYPRLKIAKSLLTDDGVIFVSIDDNEVHNLRVLMNEVFGEEGFIAELIWKSRQIIDSRTLNGVSIDHEYILVYGKNFDSKIQGKGINQNKYSNPDNDSRGAWMSNSILGLATKSQRPNLHYDLVDPKTNISYPCPVETGWRYSKETMQKKVEEGRIVFPKLPNGRPREKKFLSELTSEFTGFSSLISTDVGYTLNGTRELRDIMGNNYFPFPKPTSLIFELLKQGTHKNSIILDFFGGSGTTAQAVMELNKEDGGDRKFILVQIEEETDPKSEAYKAGYQYISEITKERIRRAIAKIKEETKPSKKEGELNFGGEPTQQTQDLGFKVFKLSKSNFKEWQEPASKTIQALELSFDKNAQSRLEPNFDRKAIITELILQKGFTLEAPIQQLSDFSKNEIFEIIDQEQENYLLICLDEKITEETAIKLQEAYKHHTFICRDEAITDQVKIIFADKSTIETI